MPCAISFTVETDGRLVTGRTLQEAIESDGCGNRRRYPLYYMINCAHPSHFDGALDRWQRLAEAHLAAFAPTPRR